MNKTPLYTIVKTNERYVESYNLAVTSIAREKKYLASTSGFSIESTRAFVKQVCMNKFPQYFAITTDPLNQTNRVVGWCDIIPYHFEGFLHVGELGMGVISEYRHIGIGKKLLQTTLTAARRFGLEKVELEVFASNLEAINLYKQFGFTIEGVRIKGRKLGQVYDDVIHMGLFL